MSYNRIATPRIYLDQISHNLATGFKTASSHSMKTDAVSPATVTPTSGSFEDLFDLRPSNYVTVAANTRGFNIDIDTGFSNSVLAENNFLAILGHNFEEASARFRLLHDDDSAFGSVEVVTLSGNYTNLVNAPLANTSYCTPVNNGWSLITWTEDSTNNQYYRIEVTDDGGVDSDYDDPVSIGAIMLGEYIDLPNSPDLDVGFSIDYEGSKLLTSAGGSSFAASSYLGSPAWVKTNPWVIAAEASENQDTKISRHYGRRSYDMSFSYVADTNLFQSNMHSAHGAMIDGSDLYSQFYHKTLGQHLPFLFTIDGASTSEGDYGLYRLADGGLNTRQVAHQAWNTSLSLVESW